MSLIPSFLGRRSSVFDPLSLDIWDPFEAFRNLSITPLARDVSAVANAQIDWKETSDAHIFKADLPGMKKDEVNIQLEDGRILEISGERSKDEERKEDRWHRVERARGKFVRKFRLPDNAKTDEIKASMENGVLTVKIPKHPEPQPSVKPVEISSSSS
eukprot:TRINITY_DN20631_c0_g1_i1.p1 TRINITY_DN20631_c0_g1~~TRINITY_DN20631_c0_g1_i1.p1  ORF type:complete len:158 (+),score=19.00 TRINITY_DN20631_c0_g1_i1:66-539(+)